MPDGPDIELPESAHELQRKQEYNEGMRKFADARDIRYRDPGTGRIYYPKTLREQYARHVLDLSHQDQDAQNYASLAYQELLAS